MVGCYKITDAGVISLSKLCPQLQSVDLSSTSVNCLPRTWSHAVNMKIKATGCPLLSSQADVSSRQEGRPPFD